MYSRYSGHVYSGHSDIVAAFPQYKIHLFYYIQVGDSGQKGVAQGGDYIRSVLYC